MALTKTPIELSSTPGIVDNSNATAITIDSSENVMVGKTTLAIANEGIVFEKGGAAEFTTDAARVMRLNRTSDDGSVLEINKDGTTVGSIGVDNNDNFQIGATTSGHGGLYFGNGSIAPMAGNSRVQDTLDLGNATYRFKDLHLSGGAYLGGTAAANKLEDYETGTWSPSVSEGSAGASSAQYTKVGRMVTVCCVLSNFTNITSSSIVTINGLPFNTATSGIAVGSMLIRGCNRTGVLTMTPYVGSDTGSVVFYMSFEDSNSYAPLQHNHFKSTSADILFSITYQSQ